MLLHKKIKEWSRLSVWVALICAVLVSPVFAKPQSAPDFSPKMFSNPSAAIINRGEFFSFSKQESQIRDGEQWVQVSQSGSPQPGTLKPAKKLPADSTKTIEMAAQPAPAKPELSKIDLLAGPNAKKTGITIPKSAPESVLTGFRSAKFGMNEKQVRAAIVSDFGKQVRIFPGRSAIERTRSLTLQVPELLPGGGKAQISYVFGFRSKLLIQVGVVWSKATDPKLKPTDLVDNGALLKKHFLSETFEPDTVQVDALVNGGLLLFRGKDERNHTAMLLLQGKLTGGEKPELKPEALALIYSVNPDNPDVLKIKKSDF